MNKTCPFCQSEIKQYDANHIYRCNPSITKSEAKFQFISYNNPYISKYGNLLMEYEERLKSLPVLIKEFNIDSKAITFLLDYHGIKKRTLSESAKLISVPKYKKTCLTKYGVDNVSVLDSIKIKKKDKFTENYGVDNIWKSEEYREWLNSHMLEKYNAKSVPNLHGNSDSWGWNKLTKEEKQDRLKTLHSNFTSKLELRVKEIIKSLNIDFEHQYYLKGQAFDFLVGGRLLIEVNGDYWHANPLLFTADDMFFFRGEISSKDIWSKDKAKIQMGLNEGFITLTLWESELKDMSDDNIILRIVECLNNK
jgi:hypothetical protein